MASQLKICEFAISDNQDFDSIDYSKLISSKNGKALMRVFLIGPSKSVDTIIADPAGGSGTQQPNPDNAQPNPDNPQPNPDNQSPSESYSIRNAYLNYSRLFEADDSDESGDGNNGDSGDNGDSSPESGEDSNKNSFKPLAGTTIIVTVKSKGYGYSIWTLKPHDSVKGILDNIVNKLKVGKFEEACKDANTTAKTTGLVPIKVETFINEPDQNKLAFVGRCRFAIDSGLMEDRYSSSNTSDADQLPDTTVTVAMAPLDGNNQNKPSEDMVYKVDFQVLDTDKLAGGKLKSVLQKLKSIDDKDAQRDETQSELSKYLNSAFKTPGDSSMFDDFQKIAQFINDRLSDNSLDKSSIKDNWTEFINKCKSGDRLLCF